MVRRFFGHSIATLLMATAFLPVTVHGSWKFLVYGDSRGTSSAAPVNTNVLRALAEATTNEHASFVLVPGDLVYSGSASAFAQWTNAMAPVYQAGIPVYPVLGNHDADDVPAFTDLFGPGIPDNGPAGETDRTYWFVHENALVVSLDDFVTMGRINQVWLDGVLASNFMPHVFVQGHLPAFKVSHADCLDDYPTNRNTFWNSLRNAGARTYFCGHDHFYDHARLDDGDSNPSNDLHQFIVGSGGAPLRADGAYDGNNGSWTPDRVTHDMTNGYLVVEVDGLNVACTWKRRAPDGTFVGMGAYEYQTLWAFQPLGWVFSQWPYAYSINEAGWYYFNQPSTQWRVGLPAGDWQFMSQGGTAAGWNYYRWPYCYSMAADGWFWFYMDTNSPQWCINLKNSQWSTFGH